MYDLDKPLFSSCVRLSRIEQYFFHLFTKSPFTLSPFLLPRSPSPTLTCPSPSSHLEWPQSVCISYTNISSPSFSLPLFPPFSPIPCSLYLSACIQHYCLFSIHILLIISSSTPFILVLFIPIHTSNNIILFNSRFIIQQRQDNDRKQRMIFTINALFTFL